MSEEKHLPNELRIRRMQAGYASQLAISVELNIPVNVINLFESNSFMSRFKKYCVALGVEDVDAMSSIFLPQLFKEK